MEKHHGIGRRQVLGGLAMLAMARPAAVIAKSSSPGSSMLGGVVPAAEFGLMPDTAQDQSGAMQRAVDAAAQRGLPLLLPAGKYVATGVRLPPRVTIYGVDGGTQITSSADTPIFFGQSATGIFLKNIGFDGQGKGPVGSRSGLLAFSGCDVRLEGLAITTAAGNGLFFDGCTGWVGQSSCITADVGIFAINSHELTITQSRVSGCANGGILVWRDNAGVDGTIVSGNHVSGIAAKAGGSGQNGNGINIYRADDVVVADNFINDCDFSAVRANGTRNVAIRGNTCTRLREVAIYSEFGFSGSLIAGNIVDGAAAGISITNLDQDGRLAVCSGNIVRNITPNSATNPDVTPYGIYAEADTAITGNTVSDVPGLGIGAGTGKFLRNVLIADNVIANVDTGIGVSVADGAGTVRIAGNMISNSRVGGIVGLKWDAVASADLVGEAGRYANVTIEGNVVDQ